jgi:hypothetical protein
MEAVLYGAQHIKDPEVRHAVGGRSEEGALPCCSFAAIQTQSQRRRTIGRVFLQSRYAPLVWLSCSSIMPRKDKIMDLQTIRSKLRELYDPKIMNMYHKIIEMVYSIPDDLFGPFVPHVFTEYLASRIKLLVVGQQTNGGIPLREACEQRHLYDKLVEPWIDFEHGRHYTNSPFWQFVHELNLRLGNSSSLSFVWTNLSKLELSNGLPKSPFKELNENDLKTLYPEIEILEPDFVVALTGHDYDSILTGQLIAFDIKAASDSLPPKELALIEGAGCAIYRTYHPKYLRLSKKYSVIMETLISLMRLD